MFQTKIVDKIKIHILFCNNLFKKSNRLWNNVEKFGRARQATDDNIIRRMHFACWKNNYWHKHKIINTYWFSTATMVTQKRLHVSLCVHCLVKALLYYCLLGDGVVGGGYVKQRKIWSHDSRWPAKTEPAYSVLLLSGHGDRNSFFCPKCGFLRVGP